MPDPSAGGKADRSDLPIDTHVFVEYRLVYVKHQFGATFPSKTLYKPN